ncbi:MAG: molybdenum cofactor biosynthesis protein MoaE [Solirubrobacterales bacterium]
MLHRIRLFAVLRERAGTDLVEVEVADGATVGDALRGLAEQHPDLAPALATLRPLLAVNREYADEATVLAAGDELALIPPVSGGAGGARPHARVLEEPLSAERLAALVATDGSGAIVTFQGTTRDVDRLDYEAYLPMAEERIAAILADALVAHEIEGAAAEHRVGSVPRREPSVVVAVAAAHRGPAFAAAREVIDRIKAEAPIWKREVEGERAEWVEGTPPPRD